MSQIERFINNVTPLDAKHLNELVDTLNTLVDKNETVQVDIGNLNDEIENINVLKSQYEDIKTKVDKIEQGDTLVTTSIIDSTLTLTTDKLQTTTMQDNTAIILPNVDKFTEIHLFFSTESELTLILPNIKWQSDINIEANKVYEFVFTYTTEWLGGCVIYG